MSFKALGGLLEATAFRKATICSFHLKDVHLKNVIKHQLHLFQCSSANQVQPRWTLHTANEERGLLHNAMSA